MENHLIQTALSCGAYKAQIICGENIVLNSDFRVACQGNQCGLYGRCWMCPPDIGEIQDLMNQVRRWPKALLYQNVYTLEDSFDIEGMTAGAKNHAGVSQKIHARLKEILGPSFLHLTCGGCRLCDVCTKTDGLPCRHPDQALPSLEGYGVDVYGTCKNTLLKYINGSDTVTYFGMALFGG